MKIFIFSLLIATFFVVAFAQTNEGPEETKKYVIIYLKSLDGINASEAELNAKDTLELIDMAIDALKKKKAESKGVEDRPSPDHYIGYFERLKDDLIMGPTKIQPITDPNHVSKVHHVDSEEDFDNQLKNAGSKLVVVDFFAKWCGPCKTIAPYLDAYADKYESQIVLLKVDVNKQDNLATNRFQVSRMPTFVFMKNGGIVEQFSGADATKIQKTIEKLLN